MGEDRTTCVEKKPNDVITSLCRHRHSSMISSCSEDAESESTSAGYPQSPDEEREEELEYGPGIVNKLRTRFLSISLKQNRGTNMRRSCSMENLLDQDRPNNSIEKTLCIANGNGVQSNSIWSNLKRAKSMDTLLMEMKPESSTVKDLYLETNGEDKKVPKIIKRREGGLSRLCDEELPKPDTVKTYKRMFEPAESRRGSYCRRPPVLRASAKSCAASKINGTTTNTSAKVNGVTTRSKYSAKQSPSVKAQSTPEIAPVLNGNLRKPVLNGEPSRPLYNGCHVVKANPMKSSSNAVRNGKDLEKNLNSINRLLNKKEVHFASKTDIITNGNGCHKEILKIKTNDDVVKQFNCHKPTPNNMILNGNSKPKVPPNRPTLKSPKPLLNKPEDQKSNEKIISKLKPKLVNGLKKPFEVEHNGALPSSPKDNAKVVQESKPKVETNSLESKQEEIKIPSKDGLKLPVEKHTNGDIKPELENSLQNEIKSPEDTSSISNTEIKTKEETKSQAKDTPKVSERTVEPDLKIVNGVSTKPAKAPAPSVPPKKPENGHLPNSDMDKSKISKQETVQPTEVKRDIKPVKKQQPAQTTSMVFDFRGKDVVPHVAVLPVPFGCKSLNSKKRPSSVDGKEIPNSNGTASDDEDDDFVDYSVPPPSGVIFEGENVKIGRGSILAIRNKDLKITFDDDVDNNTFVYPSENSLLEDHERSLSPSTSGNEIIPNGQPPPASSKLKINTSIGNSSAGGLSTYTPSVLRTVDNFEPGMFRPAQPDKEDEKTRNPEEDENTQVREEHSEDPSPDMLKPADPDLISSWSLSAGTSDLLF